MESLILELIKQLDNSEDLFLIELLKQKISKIKTKKDYVFYEKDIYYAKKGLLQKMRSEVTKFDISDIKYKKAEKIRNNHQCENCKLSVWEKYTYWGKTTSYKTYNKSNPVCYSCFNRDLLLRDFMDKYEDELDAKIVSIITPDVIKLKVIINLLNNKLKSKNYDASKHKINV